MSSGTISAGVANSEGVERLAASLDAPFKRWYIAQFSKQLPAVLESELLTTYFSTSYGQLYEYCLEFLRVQKLIVETKDQDSVASDARRMGWKWYRVAGESDDNVHRDEGGKRVQMTEDEISEVKDAEQFLSGLQEKRMSELSDSARRLQQKGAEWAAENLVYIVSDRLGEMSRVTKEFANVLPCYLFHVRYPNDGGDDLWTAQSFAVNGRTEEESVHTVCRQLHEFTGKVKSMLRETAEVLKDPGLLKRDIDERRKTRSVDLESVNAVSSNTSARIAAEAEFRAFLVGRLKDV